MQTLTNRDISKCPFAKTLLQLYEEIRINQCSVDATGKSRLEGLVSVS